MSRPIFADGTPVPLRRYPPHTPCKHCLVENALCRWHSEEPSRGPAVGNYRRKGRRLRPGEAVPLNKSGLPCGSCKRSGRLCWSHQQEGSHDL